MSTPKAKSSLFLASSLCDGLEDNNIRQVTTLLLNKDADPNVLIPTHGVTPFHLVIGNDSIEFAEEVTKLFLRHGGDPNVRSIDGMTPVHVAAAWGRINILQLLLANGGDPLCLDNDGCSPFHYAFNGKYFKAVTMLAKHCDYIRENEDDKPKYNMVLDKVLVTNGNIVAEYVASKSTTVLDDQDIDNTPRNNDVSSDFYERNSFPMCVKSNCVADIYNTNELRNNVNVEYKGDRNAEFQECSSMADNAMTSQEINLSLSDCRQRCFWKNSFVDLNHDFANLHLSRAFMREEKCLVSKIINHLSTTLAISDCTLDKTVHNYKRYRREKSVTSNFDMLFKSNEDDIGELNGYKYKNSKIISSKLKHNRNKDTLKPSTPSATRKRRRRRYKYNAQSTSKKKYKEISDSSGIPLTSTRGLDNSIISMSPNFNRDNYKKKRNTIKSSLILSHIIRNDPIVSKSPNFTTPVCTIRKRDAARSLLFVDDYVPSKIFKKLNGSKIETRYSEFNRCKKHVAQSTPRRKKMSIYKFHSGKKRFDYHQQESDVTADESITRNTLKPINLDKIIFSETTEDATHYDILHSNFEPSSSNFFSGLLKTRQQNCYNNSAIKLEEGKYNNDGTMHSSSINMDSIYINLDNSFKQMEKEIDSTRINLDNSFNEMEKENVDSFDGYKNYDIKCGNYQTNTLFVTKRKDRFKPDEAPSGTLDRSNNNNNNNNVKSTYTTDSDSLYNENFMDYIDCDNKKLLHEDKAIDISEICDLHEKNWQKDIFQESLSKWTIENKSYVSMLNQPIERNEPIHLSNSQGLYSSRTRANSTDFKRADDTLETKDSGKTEELNSSLLSYVSAQEEYKYEDSEKGVILLERRLCVTPLNTLYESKCDVKKNKMTVSDASGVSNCQGLPKEMLFIDDATLKRELTELGNRPGPITSTTRRVYLKRLMHLKSITSNNILPKADIPLWDITKNYAEQDNGIKPQLEFGDWVNHLNTYGSLEKHVFQEFVSPNPSRRWREGISKTCFTYLLLDPRVTQDLPYRRNTYLKESEVWSIFLNAIFYIGKGKRSRPFAHLYDAFNTWVTKTPTTTSKKINCILDIWNNDYGVVCLHVFQNIIPVEAYTREAAMIDAMGIERLKNCKGGEYYGIAATWSMQQKQDFGRYLLYKALQILLHEGERQLFPQNL